MSIEPVRNLTSPLVRRQPAQLTVTIHHSKLANWLESSRKLGPLAGSEWSRHFDDCFLKFQQRSPQFAKYFADVASFLGSEKKMQQLDSPTAEKVISSLQLEFNTGFIRHIAKATGLQFEQVYAASLVFLTLKELPVRIALRQQEGRPFADLIKKTNAFMVNASKDMHFNLIIN
jgi:hypothetical protein